MESEPLSRHTLELGGGKISGRPRDRAPISQIHADNKKKKNNTHSFALRTGKRVLSLLTIIHTILRSLARVVSTASGGVTRVFRLFSAVPALGGGPARS